MIDFYPCFEYLKQYNNIWLYSDPHFSDPEMKKLRKPYISDAEQVKRINSKVGKKDVIIFLGDIGNTDFIKQIKGYKILIMGNHDKGISNYKRIIKIKEEIDLEKAINDKNLIIDTCYNIENNDNIFTITIPNKIADKYKKQVKEDNHLFDEVYEGIVCLNSKIVLSHEPINIPFMFNIHGHDHACKITDNLHLNICAEHINYTPVSLLSLVKNGLCKNVESVHRITIDHAIERKSKRQPK